MMYHGHSSLTPLQATRVLAHLAGLKRSVVHLGNQALHTSVQWAHLATVMREEFRAPVAGRLLAVSKIRSKRHTRKR